jgi:hypothetical protein
VVLYHDPKKGKFSIVAVAQDGLALAEIGSPTELSDSEFDSSITTLLLHHLDVFKNNVFSPEQARGGTRDDKRRFVREHLSVHVERLPSGDLIMKPLHHERGGYVGKTGEQIIVPKEDVFSGLSSAIREAFQIAT